MVFGFPRKFPHSILRDAEELEGPTLFQHSHQLGFSTNFLLIVQNCVHKKREILCRQPRQLKHHLSAVQRESDDLVSRITAIVHSVPFTPFSGSCRD